MGEEGILPYFVGKNTKKKAKGRLRRVKCKISPPEKP